MNKGYGYSPCDDALFAVLKCLRGDTPRADWTRILCDADDELTAFYDAYRAEPPSPVMQAVSVLEDVFASALREVMPEADETAIRQVAMVKAFTLTDDEVIALLARIGEGVS